VQKIIQRALGSTFIRHNLVYFFGSSLVAVLNYLYYPVVGRLLSPADFGEVQAIISFFLQTAVLMQVLGLVTLGIIKKYPGERERAEVSAELEWLAILAGAVLFVLALLLTPWLTQFLNFRTPAPFVIFAVGIFIGIPTVFSNAYLQGMKRFGQLALAGIVASASKLVFSAAFVLAGLRTAGAVLGLAVSQVVMLAYTYILARPLGRPPVRPRRALPDFRPLRPELRYGLLVLATALTVNVILSIDILAAKHYFPPTVAGLYAGIATVARIIYWLTGPLSAVLIASVTLTDPATNRAFLLRSLALTAAIGGSALAFFTLFPVLTITLLIGARYTVYAAQLPRLSLAIFILSLANILLYYHVALRRALVAPVALIGLAAMGILLIWQHQSIPALVTSLIEGSTILLILVSVMSFRSYKWGRSRS
jgi:O-antigen/teichoic acid export membrane protein